MKCASEKAHESRVHYFHLGTHLFDDSDHVPS